MESQGCPKCSHVMPKHLKDYEIIKDNEIIDEGLINYFFSLYRLWFDFIWGSNKWWEVNLSNKWRNLSNKEKYYIGANYSITRKEV